MIEDCKQVLKRMDLKSTRARPKSSNQKANKLREIEIGEMHVEILPPKVKYLGKMITFVDQETTEIDMNAHPKDNFEDWIEYLKRRTKEADEKMLTYSITHWVETQEKLKWRQALRIATQCQERWTTKVAEWNPGLNKSTKRPKGKQETSQEMGRRPG